MLHLSCNLTELLSKDLHIKQTSSSIEQDKIIIYKVHNQVACWQ